MSLYAIGDIQGCSERFDALLAKLEFDRERDRLWLVGDLVNRGPDSAGVLRRVMAMEDRVTCVLGNHDLHLLAAAAGVRPFRDRDTFGDVLSAADAAEMIDWLRHRPLLHWDKTRGIVLVHAGVPPVWSLEKARLEASIVEATLSGPDWQSAIENMYGDTPLVWAEDLDARDRFRYTVNALTRMRYCGRGGQLDLSQAGPPGSQPDGLIPWFDVAPARKRSAHIVFGHWSTLGLFRREDITALDSGCIWGRSLTAIDIDAMNDFVAVDCPDPRPA